MHNSCRMRVSFRHVAELWAVYPQILGGGGGGVCYALVHRSLMKPIGNNVYGGGGGLASLSYV